jgi:hypothetical protein
VPQVPAAVPPALSSEVLQISCGAPPAASTRFNLPVAQKPMLRLSGDQNGKKAPSVPGSARASRVSSERTQSIDWLPPLPEAKNASFLPSGESASQGWLNVPPSGGWIWNRVTSGRGGASRSAARRPWPERWPAPRRRPSTGASAGGRGTSQSREARAPHARPTECAPRRSPRGEAWDPCAGSVPSDGGDTEACRRAAGSNRVRGSPRRR